MNTLTHESEIGSPEWERHGLTNHLAASFTNTTGDRIVSLQLLNANRRAVANIDFRNGKVERFDSTREHVAIARTWLAMQLKLMAL